MATYQTATPPAFMVLSGNTRLATMPSRVQLGKALPARPPVLDKPVPQPPPTSTTTTSPVDKRSLPPLPAPAPSPAPVRRKMPGTMSSGRTVASSSTASQPLPPPPKDADARDTRKADTDADAPLPPPKPTATASPLPSPIRRRPVGNLALSGTSGGDVGSDTSPPRPEPDGTDTARASIASILSAYSQDSSAPPGLSYSASDKTLSTGTLSQGLASLPVPLSPGDQDESALSYLLDGNYTDDDDTRGPAVATGDDYDPYSDAYDGYRGALSPKAKLGQPGKTSSVVTVTFVPPPRSTSIQATSAVSTTTKKDATTTTKKDATTTTTTDRLLPTAAGRTTPLSRLSALEQDWLQSMPALQARAHDTLADASTSTPASAPPPASDALPRPQAQTQAAVAPVAPVAPVTQRDAQAQPRTQPREQPRAQARAQAQTQPRKRLPPVVLPQSDAHAVQHPPAHPPPQSPLPAPPSRAALPKLGLPGRNIRPSASSSSTPTATPVSPQEKPLPLPKLDTAATGGTTTSSSPRASPRASPIATTGMGTGLSKLEAKVGAAVRRKQVSASKPLPPAVQRLPTPEPDTDSVGAAGAPGAPGTAGAPGPAIPPSTVLGPASPASPTGPTRTAAPAAAGTTPAKPGAPFVGLPSRNIRPKKDREPSPAPSPAPSETQPSQPSQPMSATQALGAPPHISVTSPTASRPRYDANANANTDAYSNEDQDQALIVESPPGKRTPLAAPTPASSPQPPPQLLPPQAWAGSVQAPPSQGVVDDGPVRPTTPKYLTLEPGPRGTPATLRALTPGEVVAAPPPSALQHDCLSGHARMLRSANAHHAAGCQTCGARDAALRWRCAWCALRVCTGCRDLLHTHAQHDVARLLAFLADPATIPPPVERAPYTPTLTPTPPASLGGYDDRLRSRRSSAASLPVIREA